MEIGATKKIAKNFSWLFTGGIISGSLNFLAIIYLARTLHASAYGIYSFVQAFLIYLLLLVDSGLSLYGTREIAREKSRTAPVALNVLAVRLVIASLVYILSSLGVLMAPLDPYLRWLFLISFLIIFSRALSADWIFQGIEKMEYIAAGRALNAALSFGLIMFFVRRPDDLLYAPAVQFLCGLIVSICLLILLFRRFLAAGFNNIAPWTWINIYKQALPLGASVVLIQIYANLDIIMLGVMDKKEIVGCYNAAYQLFNVLVAVFAAWQATALPVSSYKLSTSLEAARLFLDKYLRLTLLAVIPAVAAVFIAAPSIVVLIFGPEYILAAPALRYLVWNLIAIAIGSVFSVTILVAAGRYNSFFIAGLIGAAVNIALNFLLIPRYSFAGAAIATILAEASSASYSVFQAYRVIKLDLMGSLLKPAVMSLLAAAVSLLASAALRDAPVLVKPLMAASVFAASYAAMAFAAEKKFILGFVGEITRKS